MAKDNTILGVEAFSCETCDIAPFVSGQKYGYQTYSDTGTVDMFPAASKKEAIRLGKALAVKFGCSFYDLDN